MLPDGVNLAIFVHELSAQQSSSGHLILEAVQLVLQCLEAGRLGLAQMLLVAAHLHSSNAQLGNKDDCCAFNGVIVHECRLSYNGSVAAGPMWFAAGSSNAEC